MEELKVKVKAHLRRLDFLPIKTEIGI